MHPRPRTPERERPLPSTNGAGSREAPPDFEALAREHRDGYPPDFAAWSGEWRNAYFGAASRLWRKSKTDSRQSAPRGTDSYGERGKFKLEPFENISCDAGEEWLVKRLLPRRGAAAIYGRPGSFKSFVALNIGLSVALGERWAGRRVTQTPVVYICAEGAHGFRKRAEGLRRARSNLPRGTPLYLIAAAPNLGVENGDLGALILAIESAGVAPGLIELDTLAQSLGSADENGAGMTAFIANAGALAQRFGALVLIVHHSGLGDDRRPRGHSSLNGALDAQILCERVEGELAASLTVQKLKDDASDMRFKVSLSRVRVGQDEDGEEISTLVVSGVEAAEPRAKGTRPKKIPRQMRLFMDVVTQAIDQLGESFEPQLGAPLVKGVADRIVRERFFERVAEQAEPGENPNVLADRRRQAFRRVVNGALNAEDLIAVERNGERFLILPVAGRDIVTPPKGGVSRPSRSPASKGVTKIQNVTNVTVCHNAEKAAESGQVFPPSVTVGVTNARPRECGQVACESGDRKNEDVTLERNRESGVETADDDFAEGKF